MAAGRVSGEHGFDVGGACSLIRRPPSYSRRALVYSPQSDPALDLTTEALAYADGVTRKDARRALVLARSGERWVGPLAEGGFAVAVQQDVSALGVADGSMDLVLLEVLCHTQWDRCVLQQLPRLLQD